MDLNPIHRVVIGLDIHQATVVACAIVTHDKTGHDKTGGEPGETRIERQTFGAFKRDRRALADWCAAFSPDVVVMESTGIYWKSPYAALERRGIRALVVNARHVKNVPGRKTDIADAEWLASLARAGLLRGSFVPIEKMRELRLVARQRQKLGNMLAAEKNRLGKVLADAGIRLGVVVSDINGKSARGMIAALIEGRSIEQALVHADPRLKAPRDRLAAALEGDLSEAHRFVLGELIAHIRALTAEIARFDAFLLGKLTEPNERQALALLQTIPGIDRIGAALLLVEIGTDMSVFRSPDAMASWAGVCPANNESAGKRKGGKKRKGNSYVRRLLCEFANAAAKTKCAFRVKYQGLTLRRGYKRAIFACAHKMLRTIHAMLSKGVPYRDTTVDLEALIVKRNAPRWIKALARHGHLATAATR